MCGIVGIISDTDISSLILEGLKRLEYRGYDSAGIACVNSNGLDVRKAEGKLCNLESELEKQSISGSTAIGHTRWATHGAPTKENAHPHLSKHVAIVHNGIIENFFSLKEELKGKNYEFSSETDSEVIAHLINEELNKGSTPYEAVSNSYKRLKGAFAIVVMFKEYPNIMIGMRKGAPLAVGFASEGLSCFSSDKIAIMPFIDNIIYLEEGDLAQITDGKLSIWNDKGETVTRLPKKVSNIGYATDKGNYRHFMLKEIHEQSEVLNHTCAHYIDMMTDSIKDDKINVDFNNTNRLTISACGSAYYAALVGKYWLEKYARLIVDIDIASEFRYREIPLDDYDLCMFVSQSGETADTLASLKYCKDKGKKILSIVNVEDSSIHRLSDNILPTLAGPEIGVASTKAFTCQLAVFAILALQAAKMRGKLSEDEIKTIIHEIKKLPRLMTKILSNIGEITELSKELSHEKHVLFIGRGIEYPIALEGALKLKEISYIHAEAYAAGELKHGPIALIDENMQIIAIAPNDNLFDKTLSNIQEISARDGKIIIITDADNKEFESIQDNIKLIEMPSAHEFIQPILYTIPMQLIAYYTAVARGTDVDQPRNLAKSVTVE